MLPSADCMRHSWEFQEKEMPQGLIGEGKCH